MGMAPRNSTILLNTKVSLKGLSSASLEISHLWIGAWDRTLRTVRLRCKSLNSSLRVGLGSSGCRGSMIASLKFALIALIECARYSIGDGFQHGVDFVGHLALLLFEIGFKLG
ncbi:hypothetical protein Tco_1533785 [Tanacetum coccineum]